MLSCNTVVARGASPDRAELAERVEASIPGRDLSAILDPVLDTALTRATRDPEAPLDEAIRERARAWKGEGVDINRLLEEYAALRSALMRLWEDDAPGPLSFLRTLNEAIDEAIVATVQEYRVSSELLSMICHDLRNPLQSVLLCGTQLERLQSEDPRLARVAEVILRATARMNRILDDLSVFATMDLHALPQVTAVDLRELLDELVEAHRGAVAEKKLVLSARVDHVARAAVLDKKRVMRIIHHLINHAIKVSPLSGSITLGVRTDERATRFTVEHAGRSPRSLDMGIARALVSGLGGDLRLERDSALICFSIFG